MKVFCMSLIILPVSKMFEKFTVLHTHFLWVKFSDYFVSFISLGSDWSFPDLLASDWSQGSLACCMQQQARVASEHGDSCSNTFVWNNSGVITQHLLASCHSHLPWTLMKKYRKVLLSKVNTDIWFERLNSFWDVIHFSRHEISRQEI